MEDIKIIERFDIPGMPKENKLHMLDASQRIIHHKKHSYDKYGRVIVVDAPDEDLEESIGQYQKEVGPKNVVKAILNGADPNVLLHQDGNAGYIDVVDMDAHSINEFRDNILDPSISEAQTALADFNKKYGTNLDMNAFMELVNNKTLESHVQTIVNNKTVNKTVVNEGGDK